jgi:hypothetical protein
MRRLFGVIFVFVYLWGFPSLAAAEQVTIESSTVGKLITSELTKPIRVSLGAYYPVVAVWVKEVARPTDGSDPCPTGLTDETKGGVLLARFTSIGADPTFHEFSPLAGWGGGVNAVLCGLLDSGEDPVTLYVSFY